MKKFLLLAVLIPSVSSAGLFGPSDPLAEKEWKILTEVSADLHPKFTYKTDLEKWGEADHHEQGVTGDAPFSGDCEEYALAAFVQAYRRGVFTMLKPVKVNGEGHMITCGKYYCADNLHPGAFPIP